LLSSNKRRHERVLGILRKLTYLKSEFTDQAQLTALIAFQNELSTLRRMGWAQYRDLRMSPAHSECMVFSITSKEESDSFDSAVL
jgi:hypothetical protein